MNDQYYCTSTDMFPFHVILDAYNRRIVLDLNRNGTRQKPPLSLHELDTLILAQKMLSEEEFNRYMRGRCNDNAPAAFDLALKVMFAQYEELKVQGGFFFKHFIC